MILTKEMLTKATKRGRGEAVELLNRMAQAGGIPIPHYEYNQQGSTKKPKHFCKVRFQAPEFLRKDGDLLSHVVVGSGRCSTKKNAKTLAALEVIHRIQDEMDLELGGLKSKVTGYEEEQSKRREEIEATPVDKQITGVSWESVPVDPAFAGPHRIGRIQFFPELLADKEAFVAAKALTLSATDNLPELTHHATATKNSYEAQRFANIRPYSGGGHHMIVGPHDEQSKQIDKRTAELRVLRKAFGRFRSLEWEEGETPTSFGMAKLFAALPKHQFVGLTDLLNQVETSLDRDYENMNGKLIRHDRKRKHLPSNMDEQFLESRLLSFREHQNNCSLPVDSIEDAIPHDAAVTIVKGGTGSVRLLA